MIATGSSGAKLECLAAQPARGALAFQALDVEVKDSAAVAALLELDVLMNCQGIARLEGEESDETFVEVIDVNLSSVMRLSRAAFRCRKKRRLDRHRSSFGDGRHFMLKEPGAGRQYSDAPLGYPYGASF